MTPALWLSILLGAAAIALGVYALSSQRHSAPGPKDILNLAGRRYVPAHLTTLEHDAYFAAILLGAGVGDLNLQPGETLEAYGWRVMRQLVAAKALFLALACLIVPAGSVEPPRRGLGLWLERIGLLPPQPAVTGWTLDRAAETQHFLESLTDERDKQQVAGLVARLLFPFCKSGLRSWTTSLGSPTPTDSANASSPAPTVASLAMPSGEI